MPFLVEKAHFVTDLYARLGRHDANLRSMSSLLPVLLACAFAHGTFAQSFLPPAPYGGDQAVRWLFEQELRLPPEAMANKLDGEVELTFQVLQDGTTGNMRVTRTLGEAIDAEALRVAGLIRWHPASVGGSALDTERKLVVPINAKRLAKLRKEREANTAASRMNLDADGSTALLSDKQVDSLAAPLIPKGLRGLPMHLAQNLRYPEDARRRDIQGKVGLEFVVETSGTVSNLRTVEALGAGCDDEAMRLIRELAWQPALKGGRRVRSVMKLDIQFRLDANSRP